SENHHRTTGATTAHVLQCAEGAGVGQVKVVKDEHQRSGPADHLDGRLEGIDLAEPGGLVARRELREEYAQGWEPGGVEIESVEHAPQRRGERHVREVLLQGGTSRATDSHSVKCRRELV